MIEDAVDRRRRVLSPAPAPEARLDYLVRLDAALPGDDNGRVILRFVPDRQTISTARFTQYAAELTAPEGAEERALAILEDVVNELVCRWVSVTVMQAGKTVHVEDRQPGWVNDALLSRTSREGGGSAV